MIAKYYFRALITNKWLWFWGIFFSFMWAAIGAFGIDRSFLNASDAIYITASWYAIITLISFSSIGVTLAMSMAWSANALIFSFRFSRLSRHRYLLDLTIAWISISIILSIFGIFFTALMFHLASGIDVFPTYLSFLKAIAIASIAGIFFMLTAVLLVLAVTAYGNIKFVQFLSFLPMVLVFVLSYQLIYSSTSKWLMYASPWNSAPSLLYAAYLNATPVNTFVSGSPIGLSWPALLASLVIWELAIFAIDVYIFGRIKPQDVETMRQL
jgi:hypothetical protein